MNPITLLREVVTDIESIGNVSTSIRAKVKDGLAALRNIEAEIGTALSTITGSAEKALASLKAEADKLGAEVSGAEQDSVSGATSADTVSGASTADTHAAIAAQTGAPVSVVTAAADAHAEATAAGIDPVAHATDAAVGAGADPVTAQQVAQAVAQAQ